MTTDGLRYSLPFTLSYYSCYTFQDLLISFPPSLLAHLLLYLLNLSCLPLLYYTFSNTLTFLRLNFGNTFVPHVLFTRMEIIK